MDVFSGGRMGEVIAVRLDRGEDVLGSIEAAAKEQDIDTGVVVSGIGTLDRARLHFITSSARVPENEFVEHEGPIELLSIDGLIVEHTPHLHTCLSIKDKVYAGHLEPGCRVLYLAEIVIARVEGMKLCRRAEAETGVSQLRQAD